MQGVPQMAIRKAEIYTKYEQGAWGIFLNYVFDALLQTRSQLVNSPAWREYGLETKKPKSIEARMESIRVKYLRNEITWSDMCENLLSINERYENTRTQYQLLCLYIQCANYILVECMAVTEEDQLTKWMKEYEELRMHVNTELAKVAYKPNENGSAHIYSRTWMLNMGWRDIRHCIPEELLKTDLYKKYLLP